MRSKRLWSAGTSRKRAQKLAKAARCLSAHALRVPMEIYSADEAGEDTKGKSHQAELGA